MNTSRREFLVRTGWVAGGLTVLSSCSFVPALPTDIGDTEDALGWIQLTRAGEFTFYCPRSEMGQGIDTGLTQVVAEELWVNPENIRSVLPATDQILPTKITAGSESVQDYFEPTALAAATMRETLREFAAQRMEVHPSTLTLVENGFKDGNGGRVSHIQIANRLSESIVLSKFPEPRPTLRSLSHRNYIGQPSAMKSGSTIVHGRPLFSRDASMEGMLFGAVARPPYLGATLISFNRQAALAISGVSAVVVGPEDSPGVLAATPMASRAGVRALNCRWSELSSADREYIHADLDIDKSIADGALDHVELAQDASSNPPFPVENELDLRFDTPTIAHAAMEPRSGLVSVKGDSCQAWTASQDPFFMQGTLAKLLGLNEQRVVVNNHRLGGSFGGRIHCQATVEAAWLSAAVSKPVKVQWTREDEFAYNYVGPQFSHRIHIEMDATNVIRRWRHQFVATPIMIPRMLIPKSVHWVVDLLADQGVARGSVAPYDFDTHHVAYGSVTAGMPTGAWRGLGSAPNTFATERAMDEAAALVGEDPIDFRLKHLSNDRLKNVIEIVRQASEWDQNSNLGIAAAIYKSTTFVAVVAETALESGKPVVKRLWCAQDCGVALSPDRIRAQIEGNMVWAIGMTLLEEFKLKDGIAESSNFNRYPIPRQSHMPEMHIHIVESSLPPTGSGEPAIAPAVAAIGNSIARLTQTPIAKLPIGQIA